MAINSTQAGAAAQQFITLARKRFYGGKDPTVFGGKLVAEVVVDHAGTIPNGNLAPVANGWGLELSQGLLDLDDDLAIRFVIGHELGHAFSETILASIDLHGISGEATEVIADLAAAHMLVALGDSWGAVLKTVDKWKSLGIFDEDKSGDHPAGERRVHYIHELSRAMTDRKETFEQAARRICSGL